MLSIRELNAEIFRDTKYNYSTNHILKQAVQNSISKQYFLGENEKIELNEAPKETMAKVIVSGKRTLEATEPYAKQGKKVCALNFASATNPGGGVVRGSSAQEEAICRCTTLYPCLETKEMWQKFYSLHREMKNPLYNNDCIFTPDIKVFKCDTRFPEMMYEKDWWNVDIITCAAPNLRSIPSNEMNPNAGDKPAEITKEELYKLHKGRIERIFQIAIKEKAQVLILGAFGCGAFSNPPEIVAKAFLECTKEYGKYFEVIEYAIFYTERETANYTVFKKEFENLI